MGFESGRYLGRWLLIGGAIGVVAGIGAIVFYLATEWATRSLFGDIVGYLPPSPGGPSPSEAGPSVAPDETLDGALETLVETGVSSVPVVEGGRVVGHLHVRDVVSTYKATLQRGVRRANALPSGTVAFEAKVRAGSPLPGRTLQQADFPADVLVASIARAGETIFPRARTRLQAGDVVMMLASPASEAALRAYLSVEQAEPEVATTAVL